MAPQRRYEFRQNSGRICLPLYKYYSNYDYAKDVINNQRIHLERPSDYNDIYDSAFYATEENLKRACNTSRNICKILKSFLPEKYYPALEDCWLKIDERLFSVYDAVNYICSYDASFVREELIEQCILGITHGNLIQADNNKISCFSERNNSLLMWAYYANNGKGVCLGFDIKSDDLLKNNCRKVQYSNHFVLDAPGFDHYFRKSEQWSHEQEWRVVCDTAEEYIPTNSLSTLILGCKISGEMRTEFLALGKTKGLDIYEIKPSTEKYELLLKPLYIDGITTGD